MRTNFPVIRHITEDKTEAEVRSASGKWRSTSTIRFIAHDKSLYVHVPFIMKNSVPLDIPLCALFKVLRTDSVDDMVRYIDPCGEIPELRRLLADPLASASRDAIINWLVMEGSSACREPSMEKKKNYVSHIFKSELLPHVGVEGIEYDDEMSSPSAGRWGGVTRANQRNIPTKEEIDMECHKKKVYIGFVVRRLIAIHLRRMPEDDRDDYQNKRFDAPGPLIATYFRQSFRAFLRQLPSVLTRACAGYEDIISVVRSKCSPLTNDLLDPYKKGNWGRTPGVNNGVVQSLNRMNTFTSPSAARKIMTPLKKEGKIPAPRQVHLSGEGITCCVETPEGQSCGLMLSLTLFARISIGIPTRIMMKMLDAAVGPTSPCPLLFPTLSIPTEDETVVFVNGRMMGVTNRPTMFEQTLMEMRSLHDLPYEMRIIWWRNDPYMRRYISINCDGSAALRPLMKADRIMDAAKIMNDPSVPLPDLWRLLFVNGIVEYVDKEEEVSRGIVVAMRPRQLFNKQKYSHVMLSPTNLLGSLANLIPFSDLNQSPRNMYYTSMVKQALSLPCLDLERKDLHRFVMWYPMKPLVATRYHEYLIEQSMGISCAQVAIWAVACLNGRNMEDSVIIKRQAMQRGLFMATYETNIYSDAKKKGTDEEIFCVPPEDCVGRHGMRHGKRVNYSLLDPETGIVPEGTEVHDGDVLIGKAARLPDFFDENGKQVLRWSDRSVVMEKLGTAIVHRVKFTRHGNNHTSVYVTLRQPKPPQIGDKFASYAAQKGTLGAAVDEWDLPFTASGIVPDIIMNAHAIPSRMTLGMMVEGLTSKASALDGKKRYADTFQGVDLDDPQQVLESKGFKRLGKERMFDGTTGEQMEAEIYLCPVAYMRLKHMTKFKVHSRAKGPRSIQTRQPTEGRRQNGGLRFGEMERDALVAHGAAYALQDRLLDNSDSFQVAICGNCGYICNHTHSSRFGKGVRAGKPYCSNKSCRLAKEDVKVITLPFASNVLIRELEAMHISTKIRFKQDGAK